ncbi:VOC family protein [Cryobacterium sp. TMT1-21]|uniref:VOC family protein n=1 Tax=Cryobacterium shii TaxID=1259235 RepID=A0AAQ2C6J9_9MICO|nr:MULTISPECIES: VOC family protein [Cryobacterium]TFC47088.1 VOC family protein [Cryobacterium shii]TFC88193.1 VOC family protein [Cryobacterium sp. TmT2-59]TFD13073.1 VOC family protein [Cryobacterium sp. TMT4-10]TFD13833.1 VOC family protein [Cryobacterium sp. TMT1-21]TFD16986.1 VOC family protein [Cryobacterium sp. TMT2-23]
MSIGIVHAFGGFAVPELAAARRFYGETLGLEVTDDAMGPLRLRLPGGAEVIVYPKPDHVPAVFTILNFVVEDIDAAVAELTARGVAFERYEGMDQDAAGVSRNGDPKVAWFTDPAGNILSVLQNAAPQNAAPQDAAASGGTAE